MASTIHQDFFTGGSVTITPVFTSENMIAVKSEPSPPPPSSTLVGSDFDDFSSWIKCEFCDYRCPKKDRLSRHVRNVHYKEKPFGCSLCDACFGRKDKMKRHIATVHSAERPYKCDFCNHSSGRKDKIREHVQSVHFKNRKPKKKYPKKPKASSSSTTNVVSLPQHPLPRHELNHSGIQIQATNSVQNTDLVTLSPVSFVPTTSSFISAASPATTLDLIQPAFHHQPTLMAPVQTIYKLMT